MSTTMTCAACGYDRNTESVLACSLCGDLLREREPADRRVSRNASRSGWSSPSFRVLEQRRTHESLNQRARDWRSRARYIHAASGAAMLLGSSLFLYLVGLSYAFDTMTVCLLGALDLLAGATLGFALDRSGSGRFAGAVLAVLYFGARTALAAFSFLPGGILSLVSEPVMYLYGGILLYAVSGVALGITVELDRS